MFEKNLVERDENERSHVYKAVIDQNDIQKVLLDKLLETAFSGSAANLVMQALGNSQPSKEELKKLNQAITVLLQTKERAMEQAAPDIAFLAVKVAEKVIKKQLEIRAVF